MKDLVAFFTENYTVLVGESRGIQAGLAWDWPGNGRAGR